MAHDDDDEPESCPLCMEPMDDDDLRFQPCPCDYRICSFCYKKLEESEQFSCPACRRPYSNETVRYVAPTPEEIAARRQAARERRDRERKENVDPSRRQHLESLRIIERNVAYVAGLPARLCDEKKLKEHFRQYGHIDSVHVVRPYITGKGGAAFLRFSRPVEARAAVVATNEQQMDGCSLRSMLGLTKYCPSFLSNRPCHNATCLNLHYLADDDVCFTDEEIKNGKHFATFGVRALMAEIAAEAANPHPPPAKDHPPGGGTSAERPPAVPAVAPRKWAVPAVPTAAAPSSVVAAGGDSAWPTLPAAPAAAPNDAPGGPRTSRLRRSSSSSSVSEQLPPAAVARQPRTPPKADGPAASDASWRSEGSRHAGAREYVPTAQQFRMRQASRSTGGEAEVPAPRTRGPPPGLAPDTGSSQGSAAPSWRAAEPVAPLAAAVFVPAAEPPPATSPTSTDQPPPGLELSAAPAAPAAPAEPPSQPDPPAPSVEPADEPAAPAQPSEPAGAPAAGTSIEDAARSMAALLWGIDLDLQEEMESMAEPNQPAPADAADAADAAAGAATAAAAAEPPATAPAAVEFAAPAAVARTTTPPPASKLDTSAISGLQFADDLDDSVPLPPPLTAPWMPAGPPPAAVAPAPYEVVQPPAPYVPVAPPAPYGASPTSTAGRGRGRGREIPPEVLAQFDFGPGVSTPAVAPPLAREPGVPPFSIGRGKPKAPTSRSARLPDPPQASVYFPMVPSPYLDPDGDGAAEVSLADEERHFYRPRSDVSRGCSDGDASGGAVRSAGLPPPSTVWEDADFGTSAAFAGYSTGASTAASAAFTTEQRVSAVMQRVADRRLARQHATQAAGDAPRAAPMATRAATAPIGGLQLSSVRYDDEGDDDGAYSDQDGVTSNGMPSPGSAVQFEPMVDARGKTTYKCPECETTIATLSLMQMHYKKHLNTNGKVKRTISQVEHLPLRPPKGLPAAPAKSTKGTTAAGSSGGGQGKSSGGPPHMSPEDWVKQQLFWSRTPKLSVVPKDRTKFETYVRKTAAVQDASDELVERLWRQFQRRLQNETSGVSSADSAPSSPVRSTVLPPGKLYCFFWQRGNCTNGDKCGYIHAVDPNYDPTKVPTNFPQRRSAPSAGAPSSSASGGQAVSSWMAMAKKAQTK